MPTFSSVDEPTIIEDKPRPESRATPLKSLLKKPSVDLSSDSESEVELKYKSFL